MKGYGSMFFDWIFTDDLKPYDSYGNGSAMRVSAIGFLARSEDEAMELAKWSAMPTHNHPEGIKGAQAVALAIYLAKTGFSKEEIKQSIESKFNYNLSRSLKEIEPNYYFDVTCQGSVPEAIIAFLESTDFESAIRNAIWLKGDADTQGCIAGGIAQAYYRKIPKDLSDYAYKILPNHLLDILHTFHLYQSYEIDIQMKELTEAKIEKLLSFIPYFENTKEFFIPPKFVCSRPTNPYNSKAQSIEISISSELNVEQGLIGFKNTLEETGFLVDYNWDNWYLDEEVFTKKERIANLDMATIRMVLSSFFKDEKYPKEDILAICAMKGHILLFLKRIEEICKGKS
jgi:hypothetical protein